MQHAGVVGPLITQNVDGLHHAALRRVFSEPEIDRRILELHGSIFVSSRSPQPNSELPFSLYSHLDCEGGYYSDSLSRRSIVSMDTFTPARYSKSGSGRPTHVGALISPSSSVQGNSPGQILMAMFVSFPRSSQMLAHNCFLFPLCCPGRP